MGIVRKMSKDKCLLITLHTYPSFTVCFELTRAHTITTTRGMMYPVIINHFQLSPSCRFNLICDTFFMNRKSSTVSMNIHTNEETKKNHRIPFMTTQVC